MFAKVVEVFFYSVSGELVDERSSLGSACELWKFEVHCRISYEYSSATPC